MDKKTAQHFVEFRNVRKVYKMGEVSIEALHDVSFSIEKGEICVIVGPSGAGKTTLLNILGGMDGLTSGQVFLDGAEVSAFSKRELASYRRYDVGFVFQFYNPIQNLTAVENVELATQICRKPLSYLLAVALTILFALVVALLLYFKLDKIDMAYSLKAIE